MAQFTDHDPSTSRLLFTEMMVKERIKVIRLLVCMPPSQVQKRMCLCKTIIVTVAVHLEPINWVTKYSVLLSQCQLQL